MVVLYILQNRNNKYDCIVIDRFLMGKDSKDNNKNKDMITYSYLPDTNNKHKEPIEMHLHIVNHDIDFNQNIVFRSQTIFIGLICILGISLLIISFILSYFFLLLEWLGCDNYITNVVFSRFFCVTDILENVYCVQKLFANLYLDDHEFTWAEPIKSTCFFLHHFPDSFN